MPFKRTYKLHITAINQGYGEFDGLGGEFNKDRYGKALVVTKPESIKQILDKHLGIYMGMVNTALEQVGTGESNYYALYGNAIRYEKCSSPVDDGQVHLLKHCRSVPQQIAQLRYGGRVWFGYEIMLSDPMTGYLFTLKNVYTCNQCGEDLVCNDRGIRAHKNGNQCKSKAEWAKARSEGYVGTFVYPQALYDMGLVKRVPTGYATLVPAHVHDMMKIHQRNAVNGKYMGLTLDEFLRKSLSEGK